MFKRSDKFHLLLFFLLFNGCSSVNYKLTSIYYGNQGWSMNQLGSLSSWTGKQMTTILLFTDWCNSSMSNLFTYQLKNIWNNKSIPIVTWELFLCGGVSQPGIIKSVINNYYNSYINDFANRLKIWLSGNDGIYGNDDDRRVYLRFGHEMNGNWYPWSLNSTPQEFVQAWRKIYDIFSGKGLNSTRLQWIWCANNADVGIYKIEDYWVGDAYVHWLGVDGYNFGATQTWSSWTLPNQVFDSIIGRLRNISSTKPLGIIEYATTSIRTSNTPDIQAKNDWITLFCNYLDAKSIKMASYFNVDKETDWAIFGGIRGNTVSNNFSAYSAYKDCLNTSTWILPNSSNARIITDNQFSGVY